MITYDHLIFTIRYSFTFFVVVNERCSTIGGQKLNTHLITSSLFPSMSFYASCFGSQTWRGVLGSSILSSVIWLFPPACMSNNLLLCAKLDVLMCISDSMNGCICLFFTLEEKHLFHSHKSFLDVILIRVFFTGWLYCPPYGDNIGLIIPSKVPLSESFNKNIPPGESYTPKEVIDQQRSLGREVSGVVTRFSSASHLLFGSSLPPTLDAYK